MTAKTKAGPISATDSKLKSLGERIERLIDERDGIQSDIRDIYAEAKSAGYVPKVPRKAITRKRMDAGKRDEEDAILELYEDALSAPMRKAVAMAAEGASARKIEAETGIDQATVARSVSLNKKPETAACTATTLRSQKASSTDPDWLEREAERADLQILLRAAATVCGRKRSSTDGDPAINQAAGRSPGEGEDDGRTGDEDESGRRDNRLGREGDAQRHEGLPSGLERQGHVAMPDAERLGRLPHDAGEGDRDGRRVLALGRHEDGGQQVRAVAVQPDGLAGDGLDAGGIAPPQPEEARPSLPAAGDGLDIPDFLRRPKP